MSNRVLAAVGAAAIVIAMGACNRSGPTVPDGDSRLPAFENAETPEHILIAALEELDFIADWQGPVGIPPIVLARAAADTTFIYGELTTGGYGAVVTERHTYPKGLLLISVRRTYGREEGRIVSEATSYISFQSLAEGDPQQSIRTELYALSDDTIVTHITRNGQLESYTFRLPVITTQIGSSPGLTRVVSRHGRQGRIVVETRDGNGALIQERTSWGESDGSLFVHTAYPDGSWRRSRTLGTGSGSVLREIHTGAGAP